MYSIYLDDNMQKYWNGVYFCITTITTTGYGDIKPTNLKEMIYAMCLMLVSCVIYGYCVGVLGHLMEQSDIIVRELKMTATHVAQYLKVNKIPKHINS
jgi:ABC-type polysaccharide/polyol phosphate export permease